MGRVFEYPVGEEVELELYYKQDAIPVDGLAVRVSLRRTDDNFYFDFLDNVWKATPTTRFANVPSIGNGAYQRKWDSTYIGAVPRAVVARWEVTTPGYEATDEDCLLFGVSSIDPGTVAAHVWSTVPAPFAGTNTFGGMVNAIKADTQALRDTEEGRWKIVNNQMIFYKPDNVTEMFRFNLFDIDGNPTMDIPAERVRVP